MLSSSFEWFAGQPVILQCSVSSPNVDVLSVEWIFINDEGTNILNTETNSSKYSGMTRAYPSLIIGSLTYDDIGSYRCTGTNQFGTGRSKTALILNVKEPTPPDIQVFQTSYWVLRGRNVTLQCEVTSKGSDILSVDWIFSNNLYSMNINFSMEKRYIGGSVTNPSLHIQNVTETDGGIYLCTATNAYGQVNSTSVQLNVTEIPFVTIGSISYTTSFGKYVKMVCYVYSNDPVIKVYWSRNTGQGTELIRYDTIGILGSSTDDPSLTIEVTTNSDSGSYICLASNRHGTGQSETTNLTITGGIPFIKQNTTYISTMFGESVTLSVEISSNPHYSTVYWEKNVNGFRTLIYSGAIGIHGVSIGNPSLTINFPTTSDDAVYVCYAENIYGIGKSESIFLTVNGGLPEVHINSTTYEAIFGEEVTIPCNIKSSPVHTYVYWEKKIERITTKITSITSGISGVSIHNPTLSILFTTMSDSGLYTCFAENVIGIGSSRETALTVHGAIPRVEVGSLLYTVLIGNEITMTCRVIAVPSAVEVYWWKRLSGDIYSTITYGTTGTTGASVQMPSLTLTRPTKSDSGEYFCFATNGLGTGGSLPIILSVIGDEPVVTVPPVNMSVNFGDNVTLPCEVNAVPTHTEVYWKHNNDGIVRYIYFHTLGIAGVHPALPSLIIQSVTTTDAGLYTCFSKNIVGTGASQQLYLTVLGDIPTVETPVQKVTVITEQTAILLCIIYANPTLTHVYWEIHKNDKVLALNHGTTGTHGITIDNPSLILSTTYISDTGLYTCVATNGVGSGRSRPIVLEVLSKGKDSQDPESNAGISDGAIGGITGGLAAVIIPTIVGLLRFIVRKFYAPAFVMIEPEIETTTEKPTKIKIKVQSTAELKQIKWHLKNDPNHPISKESPKHYGDIIELKYKFEKTGVYKVYCTVRTFCRISQSQEIEVNVFDNSYSFKLFLFETSNDTDDDRTIECDVRPIQTINSVEWMRNDVVLSTDNNAKYKIKREDSLSLTIIKFEAEKDNGNYKCKLINSSNKSELSNQICLKGKESSCTLL